MESQIYQDMLSDRKEPYTKEHKLYDLITIGSSITAKISLLGKKSE